MKLLKSLLPMAVLLTATANDKLLDARGALPQPLAKAEYIEGSRLLVSHTAVPVGGRATLVALIKVRKDHHIWDRNPGVEYLIPSRLDVESVGGVKLHAQVWPAPHVDEIPGIGRVRQHAGELVIQVPFEINDSEFEPGPVRLRALFTYQCCTDAGTCFPPAEAEGFFEFEVVPPDAPAVESDDPIFEKLVVATATADEDNGPGTISGSPTGKEPPNILLVFLGAFVGGVILNVMPCVLPVISLKVFGFMQQAGDDRGRIFRMGLVYAAGIMASFAVLAVLIASAGMAWGGLMQKPGFLIGLSAVVFAFSLSLLGVFEIQLPGAAATAAGQAASKEGYGGAFMNGILMTLLATPCVGPVLGPALGWLALLPWWLTGSGILVVGLGLATPYVLLTAFPGWLRFVPKPGPWMVTFKQVVGFILVAVVIWLLSVLATMIETGTLLGTLGLLLAVGMGSWVIGKITLSDTVGRTARLWILALVLIFGGGGLSFWIFAQRESRIPWQTWEPGIAERLAEEGYTVYVDYTAKWCPTCQVNKVLVLNRKRIAAEFERLGVYPIWADFTEFNEEMLKEIQKHGRNGVPLNIVVPRRKPDEPIILAEPLTQGTVLDALREAGPSEQKPAFWPQPPPDQP